LPLHEQQKPQTCCSSDNQRSTCQRHAAKAIHSLPKAHPTQITFAWRNADVKNAAKNAEKDEVKNNN
jgi:hypothetical protein